VVVTLIEWEHLDSGKWKKKDLHVRGSVHTKRKINSYDPDYAKKLNETMKKIFIYCEECKEKYCLAEPCMHHLSDSEEDRAKYNAYKKKAKESQRINKQRKLDSP